MLLLLLNFPWKFERTKEPSLKRVGPEAFKQMGFPGHWDGEPLGEFIVCPINYVYK